MIIENTTIDRFSILFAEHWARSWSRCTDSQPAGDYKSSTWRQTAILLYIVLHCLSSAILGE